MSWFARLYDPVLSVPEATFLRRWRAELVGDLTGRVLEIGSGTGLNLPHYRPEVDLVLTEPHPAMRAQLERRATGRRVQPYPAERLEFPEASFDVVVSTLVLCTVPDPDAALAEVHRVLKPGGELRFIEHVASDRRGWAALQRWLDPLWSPLAGGCHLCRHTPEAIATAGFEVRRLEARHPWSVPPILQPFVRGHAVRL
jgi:ubiquinone/menaquinone biosynthesis C-methylase UbiE